MRRPDARGHGERRGLSHRGLVTRSTTSLYVLQLALLGTHQVDAAYWHEWEVFGVPGGLTFFLGFNLAAMVLLGQGLVLVASGSRHRPLAVLGCAATGLVTCALHAFFLARDRTAFWAPASLSTLGAILLTALAQLVVLGRGVTEDPSPRGASVPRAYRGS
jgi:hypothetical protein